jgi:ABC-type multidrug transport system fused ATPase/permease subunit
MQQTVLQIDNRTMNIGSEQHSAGFYLAIYVGITIFSALLQSLRYLYIFVLGLRASRSMFEKMTSAVLRTPLRWVDTVPVGRVLNRFTADFNSVDMSLVWSFAAVGAGSLQVLGICAVAVFVSPYILVLAAFLLGMCTMLGRRYLGGARPLKRLESTTKSPIFELFGTALAGVSTLRGFGKAEAYMMRMNERLDDYSMATWYIFLLSRWIGWRLSLVGVIYTTVVVSIILQTPGMTAALAGFTITFTVKLSIMVQVLINTVSRIELDMNAAERIVEYTGLETENSGGEKPPAAWPTRGEIEVEKLVVRYAPDLPPVLKDVGFTVRQHERVGIVGRTGSGKSTLTLSLFRFLEPMSGAIYIDGLDISKIALQELRSRLAIIPQVRL